MRPRILFFGEAVTLAHVTRPLALANGLDSDSYDVHFAFAENELTRDRDFLFDHGDRWTRWPISSIGPGRFLRATASGARLYDRASLAAYVEEDFRLFERIRPDLVVGDLRLSLCVSAPLSRVPYVAINNAYWSPFGVLKKMPVPEFPMARLMMRWLGASTVARLLARAEPAILAHHAAPLNQLRRRYGLPPLGLFREAYTFGDVSVYADLPELVPTENRPAHHRYIGPVLWSPSVKLPAWWEQWPSQKPRAYVSLGSSGRSDLLASVLDALEELEITPLVSTAGAPPSSSLSSRALVAPYLPGEETARRCDVVICNGGSPTVYQALQAGVPVLGIASNMDQLLSMTYTQRSGAGRLLRAGDATPDQIRENVRQLLSQDSWRRAAQRLAVSFSSCDAHSLFREIVEELLGSRARGTTARGTA
ncbi:MAG TPA: glycosyltransferase [Thermoanaerobaculia bacterium]|nr:glycosyltransferase [Thermoanaerobaculia bacterium]